MYFCKNHRNSKRISMVPPSRNDFQQTIPLYAKNKPASQRTQIIYIYDYKYKSVRVHTCMFTLHDITLHTYIIHKLYTYIHYIHAYIHTHIRYITYIHTCIHTCIRTCIHTYIHTKNTHIITYNLHTYITYINTYITYIQTLHAYPPTYINT